MCRRLCLLLLQLVNVIFTETAKSQAASAPEQIHLSLGDTYTQMHVMWATRDNVTSWVTYARAQDPVEKIEREESKQLILNSQKACKLIHRAVLKGLEEGVRYKYRVHSVGKDLLESTSPLYTFTTLSTNQTQPLTFVLYGDLGVKGGADTFPALQREIRTHNHTALWHVGDFAYDLFVHGGRVGDDFLRHLEPVAANIPYMVSPGNHEIESGDFYQYKTRFSIPGTSWPMPTGRMWYSYDIGLVHFISYSTEVYFTHQLKYACPQYYWLLDDLTTANQNRHNVPWVIAMGHRPMYCSNDNGDDCTGLPFRGRVRDGLENLFHAQGVDLVIEAHEHSYERLWPVFDHDVIQTNYVNPRGSVHVISGAAGNQEGTDAMASSANSWSAYRHARPRDNNFGRLHVINSTHLYWEQVQVKDTQTFDRFWLVQHHHGPFVLHVNCSSSQGKHSSCSCPPPFYVWIILDLVALVTGLVVVGIGVKMAWKRRATLRRRCYCCRKWKGGGVGADSRCYRPLTVKDHDQRANDDSEILIPNDDDDDDDLRLRE